MTKGRLQISKTQLQICPFLTKRKQHCRAGNNQQKQNPTTNRQTVCYLVFIHVGWVKLPQQRQANIRTIQKAGFFATIQYSLTTSSRHPQTTSLIPCTTHHKNPIIQYMVFRFVSFPSQTVVLENKLAERAFRKGGAL